jgi:hypothetical protein
MSQILPSARPCASKNSNSLEISAESLAKQHHEPRRGDTSFGDPDPAAVAVEVAVAGPIGDRLGSTGKSTSALLCKPTKKHTKERVDPETGEVIFEFVQDPSSARFERFALQSAVRRLMPKSSTAKCLICRQGGKQIQVLKSKKFGTASYSGLQTCSNVWVCPVCSVKVSERRRIELQHAIFQHEAAGGQVLLLTVTHPHFLRDELVGMLQKQAKALMSFTGGRPMRRLLNKMGVIGSVRAFEVTHGRKREVSHGWHPHYHILIFCDAGIDLLAFADELFVLWRAACVRAGLRAPSRSHGLQLDDGARAAKYVTKWGLESEMTRGHTAKKTDGESPFDLLRAYLATGDKEAGALFVEFAKAFKGKSQLFWSPGLKKHFGVGVQTDAELAAKKEDHADVLGKIELDQWRDVLRVDGRARVLQMAMSGGWPAVESYLTSIRVAP